MDGSAYGEERALREDEATPDMPISPAPLSARQLECLSRIAAGQTSAEIAKALGISARTVDHYVGHAKAKLAARNRGQAVATAIRLGWIASPSGG